MKIKLMTLNRAALKMAALVLMAVCVSGRVWAVEAVDVGDSYTIAGSPNGTNGGASTMIIVNSGNLKRGWVQFDIASVLPPGTTWNQISKATLKLYASSLSTTGTVNVFAVTGGAWSEGTITHNNAPTISGTAEGYIYIGSADTFVTLDLTALVQDWVDPSSNGKPNYGIALVPAGSVSVNFECKESTGTSHQPQLSIVLSSGTISASMVSGLSPVATSGSYSSLLGLPTIPTNTNQLTNGAGFINSSGTAAALSGTILASQVSGLTFSALLSKPTTLAGYGITDPVLLSSGSYSNPSWLNSIAYSKITGAPTAISSFTNDAGYIGAGGGVTASLGVLGGLVVGGTANTMPNQTLSSGYASILNMGLADARYLITTSSNGVVLSGTSYTMPGQTLAGGSNSVLTQVLADQRYFQVAGNSSLNIGSTGSGGYLITLSSTNGSASFANGNVTIDSSGNINFTGNLFQNGFPYSSGTGGGGSGYWTLTSGSNLSIASGNNVGIGTASPIAPLDVHGNASITGTANATSFIGSGNSAFGNTTVSGTLTATTVSATTLSGSFTGSGSGLTGVVLLSGSQTIQGAKVFDGSTTEFRTPGNSNNQTLKITDSDNAKSWTLIPRANGITGNFGIWDGTRYDIVIGSNGYIGIGASGTNSPGYNLDVVGNVNLSGTLYQNGVPFTSGTGGGGSSPWILSGTNVSISSGNVGIGMTNPNAPLEVGTSVIGYSIKIPNSAYMGSKNNIGITYSIFGTDSANNIIFGSGNGSSWQNNSFFAGGNERMTILSGGNVGVGTTTPQARLDVNGNVNVSGTVTANAFAGNLPAANIIGMLPATQISGTLPATVSVPTAQLTGALPALSGSNLVGVLHGGENVNFGDINISGTLYQNGVPFTGGSGGSGPWILSGTNVSIASGYNVGIGTTSPVAPLDVRGNASITGTATAVGFIASGTSTFGTATVQGSLTASGTSGFIGQAKFKGGLVVTGTSVGGVVVMSSTSQQLLIPQQGDLSMGSYTSGPLPQ